MENFDQVYAKWRKNFNYVALLVASVVLALELILARVFLYSLNVITISTSAYLLRYLFIPSFLNFLFVFIGRYCLNSGRLSETAKNYCSILTLSAQFLVIACVHNVFSLSVAILCFPIFITLIFSDKKMTHIVAAVSVVSACISFVFAKLDSRADDVLFPVQIFVTLILLVCSYITSILLFQIEQDKNERLKASSFKQLQLEELLKCDSLTGLYNMSTFYNLLERSINNSERPVVAVVDIDNFKSVNDTWGHKMGNEVLIQLAAQLQAACSTQGHVFRYGGEEFTVIFSHTSAAQAKAMIEVAQKNLRNHMFDFMPEQRITFSCGIAAYPCENCSAQSFFELADQVMYKAKLSGKNRTLVG
ncbi:GGDEF domain-containing protein [Konateibacter massiliensis]|uniref:GGDEF domain-containing protein n=1 Tax=Konateibacter massiliensis TaxID=2002841 RepID=UPI000C153359|nr:GGDEF domain-containing protein [Konateibacter massiliensis]